jgi:hypothetical protein
VGHEATDFLCNSAEFEIGIVECLGTTCRTSNARSQLSQGHLSGLSLKYVHRPPAATTAFAKYLTIHWELGAYDKRCQQQKRANET